MKKGMSQAEATSDSKPITLAIVELRESQLVS